MRNHFLYLGKSKNMYLKEPLAELKHEAAATRKCLVRLALS